MEVKEQIMDQRTPPSSDPKFAPTLTTDEARQGVTGHNVRYVLISGTLAVVVAFVVIAFVMK